MPYYIRIEFQLLNRSTTFEDYIFRGIERLFTKMILFIFGSLLDSYRSHLIYKRP